jgi:hypothetical protein
MDTASPDISRLAADGPGFWLRPPASSDLPQITAMWERCSLATRMGRFHAPVRRIPGTYLRAVPSDPSTSLVAVAGGPVLWAPWPRSSPA